MLHIPPESSPVITSKMVRECIHSQCLVWEQQCSEMWDGFAAGGRMRHATRNMVQSVGRELESGQVSGPCMLQLISSC